MAQRVHIVLTDDLDGGDAKETVTFGLDGQTWEIDLSEANAQGLRDALLPYIKAGRKVTPRAAKGPRRRAGGEVAGATEIRAWAQANGMQVSSRGRVPAEIRAAYEAAHN